MEEMIFNLADTHLFFNDLEVSSVISYKLHVACVKREIGLTIRGYCFSKL